MAADTNTVELVFHAVQALTNLALLKLMVSFHKEWLRVKERTNLMYREYCKERDMDFIPIEK